MRLRTRIAGNLLWTWGRLGVGVVTGFLVAPFLIRHLGSTAYGLWVVIGSLTSYFGLLDFGTRGSVGRNVAYAHAKGDRNGVAALASTAAVILCTVAGMVLAATFAASFWLTDLFDVPAGEIEAAQWAFRLVGITIALNFALGVFDGLLWGLQQFGTINRIEIVFDLVRTVVTFWVVGAGHGLIALAVITLSTAAAIHLAKLVAYVWLIGGWPLSPRLVNRGSARLIFGYGLWNFLLIVGRMVTDQSATLIIAARLGIAHVTPFSIAQSLVRYAYLVSARSAEVFIPVAATLHAQDDGHRQQRLLLEGGRYSLILSLFFLPGYLFLGQPFIALWVGDGFEQSAVLLGIISLGEALPLAQNVGRAVLLGAGRPRVLAMVSMVENVVTIAAALAVARPYGLLGIAVVYAVCGALGRGIAQVVLVCRVAHIPVGTYVRKAVVPALVVVAIPAVGLALLVSRRTPTTWGELVGYGTGYGLCYGLAAGLLAVGPRRVAATGQSVLRWVCNPIR